MSAFDEGDNPHMVEVRVQDEQFFDPVLIDVKILELLKDVRDDVAHASADDHGNIGSLQKINPGLLPAQEPNSLAYFSWFSNSHLMFSSLYLLPLPLPAGERGRVRGNFKYFYLGFRKKALTKRRREQAAHAQAKTSP
jgi:hypothetical protein